MANGPHVFKKTPVRCDWCKVFTSVDDIHIHTPPADVTALEPPEPEKLCRFCYRDATKWKPKKPATQDDHTTPTQENEQ